MIGTPWRTKQMFDDFYLYLCGWLKRGHAAPISLASWWFQFCFNWLDFHWLSMKKVNISTFVYCFLYLFVAPGFLNGGIFFTLKKTICPFFQEIEAHLVSYNEMSSKPMDLVCFLYMLGDTASFRSKTVEDSVTPPGSLDNQKWCLFILVIVHV